MRLAEGIHTSRISIHGLRVEPDRNGLQRSSFDIFQSTGSVWSPTISRAQSSGCRNNFNPRAPCGARLFLEAEQTGTVGFQSTGSVWSPTLKGLIYNAVR